MKATVRPLLEHVKLASRRAALLYLVLIAVVIAISGAWQSWSTAQQTTEFIARYSVSAATAGVTGQDILSIQREVSRLDRAFGANNHAGFKATVWMNDTIVAQINPDLSERLSGPQIRHSERLPNGSILNIVVEADLIRLFFDWLVQFAIIGGACAFLHLLLSQVNQRILGRALHPLIACIKYLSTISRNIDDATNFAIPRNAKTTEIYEVASAIDILMSSLRTHKDAAAKATAALISNERESARNEAVARMTQMLAHDVRKPFSILRMGLGMLGNAKDPATVRSVMSRLVPEIDRAVSSVDGLIADVMEIGSTSAQLIQEPASPESLIEATLRDIFRVYPKSDVVISYDLKHTSMVHVHVQKVSRIFSNILGNALQAMKYEGHIWFKTRQHDGVIEFCIGNGGSAIPSENLPKLFEAFFTSGKKGGTGLGLAIAQKVVTAHGGRIWCESEKGAEYPDGKVEFYFTLPVAEGHPCRSTAHLLRHSTEITRELEVLGSTNAPSSVDKGELGLETDIVEARKHVGRALQVLVVDDEAVYRNALGAYLGRTPELCQAITVVPASNAAEALASAGDQTFDLVITDVDMEPTSLDGFELVTQLRREKRGGLICIHSNRICAADHQTAISAGADAFLPKPLARAQLLRLVLQAAEKANAGKMAATPVTAFSRYGAAAKDVPEVLLVEDDPFVRETWVERLATEAKVHVMTSFEELETKISCDSGFLDRLSYVVTDMYLDNSAGDGLAVGRLVKKSRPTLPVLLSSDGIFGASDLVGAVDRVIGKDPIGISGLV